MYIKIKIVNLSKYIVAALIGIIVTFAIAEKGIAAVETLTGSDVGGDEYVSIVLEPWEDAKANWQASQHPKLGQSYAKSAIVKGSPGDLVRPWHKKETQVYALAFHFVFPGYNHINIIPPQPEIDKYPKECKSPEEDIYCIERLKQQVDQEGNTITTILYGLEIPGIASKISVWVCGRGNEYNLEGWIEDWKGNTYIYQFGTVDFIGWRPLEITIPKSIPQAVDSFPQTKTLIFKKFVLRSTPRTSGEKVFLFFDDLKVLTNIFEVNFDGALLNFPEQDGISDLAQKSRIQSLIKLYKKRSNRD